MFVAQSRMTTAQTVREGLGKKKPTWPTTIPTYTMNTYSSTAPQSPSERKHSKRATRDCSKLSHNFRHCILPLRDIWAWMKTTQSKFTCTKNKSSRSEPNFDKVIWQGMRVATKQWEKKKGWIISMPAPCSHDCKQAFHHTVVSLLLCSALFGCRATARKSVRQSSSGIYIVCVDLCVYVYTSYGILFFTGGRICLLSPIICFATKNCPQTIKNKATTVGDALS